MQRSKNVEQEVDSQDFKDQLLDLVFSQDSNEKRPIDSIINQI
jgi:hypothetical protein